MKLSGDGRIEHWTDADSGQAGVGTCTDAGRDRCVAAAKMMLEYIAVPESWRSPVMPPPEGGPLCGVEVGGNVW
jgi:hypothetical protein